MLFKIERDKNGSDVVDNLFFTRPSLAFKVIRFIKKFNRYASYRVCKLREQDEPYVSPEQIVSIYEEFEQRYKLRMANIRKNMIESLKKDGIDFDKLSDDTEMSQEN